MTEEHTKGMQRKCILNWVCTICSCLSVPKTFKPPPDKTNEMASAQSDQSLRFCMKKAWVLSYPLSAQQSLWSDWADAQADLSLRWAHMPFCWFCHEAAHRIFAVIYFRTLPNNSSSLINAHLIFLWFPENWKSIPKSFSGKKAFQKYKCNSPDFKFYPNKLTNKNFPHVV